MSVLPDTSRRVAIRVLSDEREKTTSTPPPCMQLIHCWVLGDRLEHLPKCPPIRGMVLNDPIGATAHSSLCGLSSPSSLRGLTNNICPSAAHQCWASGDHHRAFAQVSTGQRDGLKRPPMGPRPSVLMNSADAGKSDRALCQCRAARCLRSCP